MKKDKIIYVITALIAIAAIVIIAVMGLNVSTKYKSSKQIQIYIGKSFEDNDIKDICKEVFEDQEVIVQKVELYKEIVNITVEEATDEQLEQLNTKINEKFGLENTVEDSITQYETPTLKISDIVRPYILPIGISLALILVYAGIRYRKISTVEVIGKILGFNILAEVLYISIIALARIQFNGVIIPSAIALYVMISILIFNDFETKQNKLLEQENKK